MAGRRPSFFLPYRGAELWYCNLSGLGKDPARFQAQLALEMETIARPANSWLVLFHLLDTRVDREAAGRIVAALRDSEKNIRRLAVIGLGLQGRFWMALWQLESGRLRIPICFFSSFELAKEWLVSER